MKRDAFSASGSCEEPCVIHVSTSAKFCAACGKYYVNIEKMIAEVEFGFHAKVKQKSVFLNQEKVNMLVFLWKKCKHGHR